MEEKDSVTEKESVAVKESVAEEKSVERRSLVNQARPVTNKKLVRKICIRFIWFLTGVLIFAAISYISQRQPKINISTAKAGLIVSANQFQKILNIDPALRDRLANQMEQKQAYRRKKIAKYVISDFYKDQVKRLETELSYKRENELQIRRLCTKTAIDYESSHWTSEKMKYLLKDLYDRKGARLIADLGCGQCEYVEGLRDLNFQAYGYEYTMKNNAAFIKKIDLSQKVDLGKKFDFVQSFEVGEHIYSVYEDTFIDNIVSHAKLGIVLSWSIWGQIGFMHVNSRDNEYIIRKVEERGFTYQPDEAYKFRKEYTNHFADTIMVFFKN